MTSTAVDVQQSLGEGSGFERFDGKCERESGF